MAENVILAKQTLTFTFDSGFGCYANSTGATFAFTEGQEYVIVWDNEEYTRTAFSFAAADGSTCVAVGNPLCSGAAPNEDPFAIVCDTTNGYTHYMSLETTNSHSVAIYQVEEDVPPAPIVLKDRKGDDVEYSGFESVALNTTDGQKQIFTKGVAVEGLEIEVNFAAGDMPVAAPEGTLVKSAIIKKPDALIPQNVAKGVNIAGVTGELTADTEEITVALSMADGDQVIMPTTEDTAMSKVTVKKPDTLIPKNIVEGVDIAGIVGTASASGGGGSGGALVFTTVKNIQLIPKSSTSNVRTLLVSASELAECGIDLKQYNKWYEDGDAYVPFIRISKLTDVNVAEAFAGKAIAEGWLSNIAMKPSSGGYWYTGIYSYYNSTGVHSGSQIKLNALKTTTTPLSEFQTSASSGKFLYVDNNGDLRAVLYYGSSTNVYTLEGTYLITVMLIPTS